MRRDAILTYLNRGAHKKIRGAIFRSSFGLFSVFVIYEAGNFGEISASPGVISTLKCRESEDNAPSVISQNRAASRKTISDLTASEKSVAKIG